MTRSWRIAGIAQTLDEIFMRARQERSTPAEVADRLAEERFASYRRHAA